MNAEDITRIGDELFQCMVDRRTIAPLTDRYTDITVDDAYRISLRMLDRRLAAGEKIIGKKIGVTSEAVQQMLGVFQPDFGFLTDAMVYSGEMPVGDNLIQPRAEGEIAFRLKSDLRGPGVTNEDIIAATESVMPCFEVVDSRIDDWKIKIQDTVSDNASCGFFTVNEAAAVDPREIDLVNCKMTVVKNGDQISTGLGSAALGSPVNCVAWLANTLGELDIPLLAGEIILSGSLVPLEPVTAGDIMTVSITGMGDCQVRFT